MILTFLIVNVLVDPSFRQAKPTQKRCLMSKLTMGISIKTDKSDKPSLPKDLCFYSGLVCILLMAGLYNPTRELTGGVYPVEWLYAFMDNITRTVIPSAGVQFWQGNTSAIG